MAASPSPAPLAPLTHAVVLARLAARGIDRDLSHELLAGQLVQRPDMSPQSPQHARLVAILTRNLTRFAEANREHCPCHLRAQLPVVVDEYTAPEPDLALVRGHLESSYVDTHPTVGDVLLAVEVAHTSIEYDRRKAFHYSRLMVPEYWIVDVATRKIQVHRVPDGHGGWGGVSTVPDSYVTNIDGLHVVARRLLLAE